MGNSTRHRIESIDLLRGLVMILMALDHARTYFVYGTFFAEPTDLETTTPLLFATRWITHFCAPVFVFLAGTAAFLYGSRREKTSQVSWFLFTRGLWLIILEVTVVNFGWFFDVKFSFHVLQVIWAIGLSMVMLSALVYLHRWAILAIGIVLVGGHNFLDTVTYDGLSAGNIIWYILHQPFYVPVGDGGLLDVHYPVLPWIGLMVLGYAFGQLYAKDFDANRRKRWLSGLGWGSIALFFVLRTFNIYGDPAPWSSQQSLTFSVISFLNTTKYPPSLLFLLMTMGPSFIFLRYTENFHNVVTRMVVVLGRVPLFFYVIHIYFIHLLAMVTMLLVDRLWSDYILTAEVFINQSLADYGYSLPVVYLIWIIAVVALFPLCKLYNDYKNNNRHKWWLSYL